MSCNHPYELSGEQCICKHPYKLSDQGECSECEKGFARKIYQGTNEIVCTEKVSRSPVHVKKISNNITMIDADQSNTTNHHCQCNIKSGIAVTGQNCTKENNYHCSL